MMRVLHRICPTTGLKIDRQAELLMRANAVAATVALIIGGISAILVLLTRWQVVHLLDVVWFYRVLTVHGMSMLIFFILFFEMAILYFTSGPVLNSRIAAPKLGWLAFALMVAGAVLTAWMMWTGKADVLYTSYVPLQAHPLFSLGVILFAVGAPLVTWVLFATRVVAQREPAQGWLAFALMVAGAVLTEWMMWTGKADVLYTSYVPLKAHPLFYLGVILFAVGALIVTGIFFATLVVAKREKTYEGSMPLITF